MRQGGSYRIDKPGDQPVLVHRTQDHPEGNWARPAAPAAAPEAVPAAQPAPTAAPQQQE